VHRGEGETRQEADLPVGQQQVFLDRLREEYTMNSTASTILEVRASSADRA
jgi:hypothetical protein